MNSKRVFSVFVAALLCFGCAANNTALKDPAITQTKPSVKIVIAKPILDLDDSVTRVSGSASLTSDYRSIISRTAIRTLEQSFNAGIEGDGTAKDYDVRLVVKVNSMAYKLKGGYTWQLLNNENIELTGNLEAYSGENELLWSSPEERIMRDPSIEVPTGGVINQDAAVALTAEEFVSRLAKDFSASKLLVKLQKNSEMSDLAREIDTLPPALPGKNGANFAVVIGIEKYRDITKADYAARDAESVRKYLVQLLGYPEDNVITLLNEHATRSDISKYLNSWLRNRVSRDSTVFVYYAGHGAPDPRNGEAYLVPFDGDPNYPDATAIPLKTLYDTLAQLPAKQVVVALDSCFSGSGERSTMAKGARPLVMSNQNKIVLKENMAVLAATSGNQISTSYDKAGHGMFTYFFLKTIKESLLAGKSIDLEKLYAQILPSVQKTARLKNVEQTPVLLSGTSASKFKDIRMQ